jgi:DNA-binding MarR family transcriptional regulator
MEGEGINRIIGLLSSKTNLKILKILMEGNSYPRKIARKINKTEGVVVRALKSMEKANPCHIQISIQ